MALRNLLAFSAGLLIPFSPIAGAMHVHHRHRAINQVQCGVCRGRLYPTVSHV